MSSPTSADRTRYLTAKTEEIADLDQNRNIIRIYIPGAKRVWRECAKLRDQRKLIDERVAQMEANGAISYIHTDHQSSVIAITDSVGNPISRRNYGVYGETNSAQMSGTNGAAHPFGYTGRRYDADTGLYYYRARWYDPELGTFLETDPKGIEGGINLYGYVVQNPVNLTDPNGLLPGDVFATIDEVALDASYWINPVSIDENKEYAAVIYRVDGGYSMGRIRVGSAAGSAPEYDARRVADIVALWHTHAAAGLSSDRFASEDFSMEDYQVAQRIARNACGGCALDVYVATPSGLLKHGRSNLQYRNSRIVPSSSDPMGRPEPVRKAAHAVPHGRQVDWLAQVRRLASQGKYPAQENDERVIGCTGDSFETHCNY